MLLEGETPLATSRYQIGFLAACAIVALRLGIGLHFFSQGVEKLGTSFTAGFLGSAKGPFAPLYKSMIWDRDGYARLNADATAAHWDQFRNRIVAHYHFDEGQQAAAKKALEAHLRSLRAYLDEKGDDIDQYVKSVERRDANKADAARADLASLRAHDARIDAERTQLIQPILASIDNLWKNLDNDLNALATTEQWKRHGRLAIGKIGERPFDSEFIDRLIPYFDMAVGLCLIVGLFTRPAAILGGLFLASVCISQWPGTPGAAPIYPYLIEMLALFVLAAVGAGQIAGLDFLVSGIRHYCWPKRTAAAEQRK
ncbi:MAG: DoxX family protein [Pirellulaceae bacterium]|nr:DoxX family protein [Pirellulaceae bacterium]